MKGITWHGYKWGTALEPPGVQVSLLPTTGSMIMDRLPNCLLPYILMAAVGKNRHCYMLLLPACSVLAHMTENSQVLVLLALERKN